MSQELLLYVQDTQKAKTEIIECGGKVSQQFTPAVLVASLPQAVNPETLLHSTPHRPASLDQVSELASEAWRNLQEKKLAQAAPSPKEGLSWDTPGYSSPRYPEKNKLVQDNLFTDLVEESTGTPTSLYMIGSIAVGIVIVSGTRPDLVFTATEQQQVIQEVHEALDFLAKAEPRANITFVYDIRLVSVDATPGPVTNYESAEAPWRDAALKKMGFSASRAGSVEYVKNLKASKATNWAYIGYFTKYPLAHFAYAVDEKVCMNYANDGWGSDQINRVFAHESCHIFGAADEYGNCTCGGSFGHLGVPNNNCVNCAGPHVSCLMEANVLEMCQWSRGQIGWDDRLLPSPYLKQDIGLPAPAPGWKIVGAGSFNGDTKSDLLWRRQDETGEARIWLLDSGSIISDKGLPSPAPGWKIVGVGDFNGDGNSDLLWRKQDETGEARIWLLDGNGNVISDVGLPQPAPGWKIVGIGDFNGDGKSDLVWRRQDDTGEARIWLLDGSKLVSDIGLPQPAPGWKIVGVGDFNGNGKSDLVWRRQDDTGEARIWLLDGGQLLSDIGLPQPSPGWKIVGVGDFNGDGKSDLVWRRQDDTGEARIWLLDGGHLVSDIGLPEPAPGWKIVAIGDFDGNKKADLMWRRQNETGEARLWILKL